MTEPSALLSPKLGLALVVIFSLLWVALGAHWGRGSKTLAAHMLAGRNVGLGLGAATAVATWVTSNTTMLAPQFALQMGVWGMVAYATASLGLFLFAPMARRIRQLMPSGHTSAEFFRLRYGPAAFYLFLTVSLFYALTWLVSMAMAGGLLLEALSGLSYRWGLLLILATCTAYTVLGGLRAVIGTDFIQSVVILLGVVVVGAAVLNRVPLATIYQSLEAERPALLHLFLPVAAMALFNNLLFGIGEIFHSNVWWSRAFAMRRGIAQRAYLIGALVWLPVPVAAGFMALSTPALGINVPQVNMVAPLVAGELLGAAGAVLVFVVVFASIASSIDSLLAATADLLVKDVVGGLLWKNARQDDLRRASPLVVLLLGLFAWFVGRLERPDLAAVLFRAGPLVGSAIWPVLAGLYWRTTNPKGVVAAMVSGSLLGLWSYQSLGWYTGALVGTAVSMAVVVVSTWVWPRPFTWAALNHAEVMR